MTWIGPSCPPTAFSKKIPGQQEHCDLAAHHSFIRYHEDFQHDRRPSFTKKVIYNCDRRLHAISSGSLKLLGISIFVNAPYMPLIFRGLLAALTRCKL